jgi:hypothetical protein
MQRRHHMQHRSPIIFWLLLAATLSVDAVVLTWASDERYTTPSYLNVAVHALILGQLSVVCIWSALYSAPNIWTQIAPLFAVVLAALLEGLHTRLPGHFRDVTTFTTCLGYLGLHAVLLVAALWLVQRTSFWRRRTGSARTWQFSLFHLLIATTVTAVLTALMRSNVFFTDGKWTNITFECSYVALAVASVVLWNFAWNWFLRLASVLCVAALFSVAGIVIFFRQLSGLGMNVFNILLAYYLIQAIVLSLWLAVGPILPRRIHVDEMQKQQPLVRL